MKNKNQDGEMDAMDKRSRIIVAHFLKYMKCSDIEQTATNIKICYDLSCISQSGKKIGIEVKERNLKHTSYGDIMIELWKNESLNKRLIKKQFD